MEIQLGLFVKSYKINDLGAYKVIILEYSDDNIITKYKIDRGRKEYQSENNWITVPSTAMELEFYGAKRGFGVTQTIKLELEYFRPVEVRYYPKFKSTLQEDLPEYIDYNTMYFTDVYTSGETGSSFPRKVRNKDTNNPSYITISRENENRLDFIAEEYLGDGHLWWVIAEYNNIVNPFDVPIGTSIKIPQISDIYGSGGAMRLPGIKLFQNY